MKVKKVISYVLACAVAFVLGFALRPVIKPATALQVVQNQENEIDTQLLTADNGAHLVIKADYQNPARVDFVLPEPIAPDFFVGYGDIGGNYDIFQNNPARDPLGIGVDEALALTERIRSEVPGITDNIYAYGYELSITIADSHLSRKDEIIKEVIAIIQETYGAGESI